jgi:hypothetical protein
MVTGDREFGLPVHPMAQPAWAEIMVSVCSQSGVSRAGRVRLASGRLSLAVSARRWRTSALAVQPADAIARTMPRLASAANLDA